MTVRQAETLLHWNYFLALESDLERLSRYVEFAEHNFNTYSIEIAHLLLATASEVDVVAKKLCDRHRSKPKAEGINAYCDVLKTAYPGIEQMGVTIPRYGLILMPWDNWRKNEPPQWWSDHNKVKHHRSDHFQAAHLQNVLNAMGALFIVVVLLYKGQTEKPWISPVPVLLNVPEALAKQSLVMDVGHPVLYFTKPEEV